MNTKQTESLSVKDTLKLALEALESCTPEDTSTGHVVWPSYDEQAVKHAITALRTAIRSVLNEHGEALAEQPARQPHCDDCGGFDPECPLAQTTQQQEPFGWYDMEHGEIRDVEWTRQKPKYEGVWKPLYTTPPNVPTARASKPWAGLTDEEVKHQWEIWRASIPRYVGFAKGIEAKLREKNT